MKFIYRSIAVIFLILSVFSFCSFDTLPHVEEKSEGEVVYEYIIEKLYSRSAEIDMSDFDVSVQDLQKLLTVILKNNPRLFFVNGSVSYKASSDKTIIMLFPTYDMSKEETEEANIICDREISKALTLIDDSMSDLDKALLLHDYLCLNFSYDESLKSNNMYSFLNEGMGTCQGYTYTYMEMLRAVGIECTFAASDSMVHIWNLVKLDGVWYHVDVTWDDTPEVFGICESDNFLKSDKAISTNHRDWYSPNDVVCDSYDYDSENYTSYITTLVGSGDVNGDGEVDVLDLVLLECESAKIDNCVMYFCADLDGNLDVNEHDVELLRKKILG